MMREPTPATALPSSRPRLDVRHLRLVEAIARERSVTAAAGTLHLSQSALSHQLLHLERDLGTALFARVGKRMVPTEAGAQLAATASRLLAELAEAEAALRGGHARRQPLRIAASCSTLYPWLGERLAKLAALRPQLDPRIVFDVRHGQHEALADGTIDLCITSRAPADRRTERRELFALDTVALVPRRHRLGGAAQATLRWGDLAGETLLIHDLGAQDEAALRGAVGPGAVRMHRVQLTEAIFELARAGQGIGLMSHWPARKRMSTTGLRVLALRPAHKQVFWAVWRRDTALRELQEPLLTLLARP